MTKTASIRWCLGALVLVAGLATAPVAVGQISQAGGPIRVNADRSEVRERDRQVVFTGSVDIVQGEARLRANRVILNYEASGDPDRGSGIGGGFGDITTMSAIGDVFYTTPDLKARGDRGLYLAADETIVLTGNVVLIRCEDVASGEKLTIQIEDGLYQLEGGDGRVRMYLPSGDETATGEGGCS